MSGPRRICALAVDDEPAILATFRRAFYRDFDLVTEPDAYRAVEQLSLRRFDVVFADFAMPGMNGAQFLEHVRALQPNACTFLITAHAPSAATQDVVHRGLALAVIVKPWSRADVLTRLNAALPSAALANPP
jgi:response regulator RpfG family c-di-GMP phosphodiesterase